MKSVKNYPIILLILVILSGCSMITTPTRLAATSRPDISHPKTISATYAPSPTWTPIPSHTVVLSTPTIGPPGQSTAEPLIPPPSLEPNQTKIVLKKLLSEPGDCLAPCFLGIIPGQTTLSEVKNIIIYLGLDAYNTRVEDRDFYGVEYVFDNGLSIHISLAVADDFVDDIRIDLSPEKYQPDIPRQWSSFSPETLIDQYGPPSKVDFFVGRDAPVPQYSMVLSFDKQDLIVQYYGYEVTYQNGYFHVCPLIDQFDAVRIWFGHDPTFPPLQGTPLEEATPLSLEMFANLMTNGSDNACIDLNGEAFP